MARGFSVAAALLLYAVVSVESKGSRAYGTRNSGTVVTGGTYPYAYGYHYPIFFYTGRGYHYRGNDGRSYSPAYGPGWNETAGWRGGGCSPCPCPMPQPQLTKKWVWTQVVLNQPLCVDCAGSNDGAVDVTTFEVDAFKEISSLTTCRPPYEVLVLRVCSEPNAAMVQGGLDDDQLLSSKCTVVGDEVSVHDKARMRKLLQTGTFVMQFVTGVKDEDHGKFIEPFIKAALAPGTRLGQVYQISRVLTVQTETGESFPTWAIVVIVISGFITVLITALIIYCCCDCCGCCDDDCCSCCDKDEKEDETAPVQGVVVGTAVEGRNEPYGTETKGGKAEE